MIDLIQSMLYWGAVFLIPFVYGPAAAYVYVKLLKREERRLRLLFWPVLIFLHIAGFFIMLYGPDDIFSVAVFVACLVSPIFAVSTALGLRLAFGRFKEAVDDDPGLRRWYNFGTVLIPLLQMNTIFWVIILAPSV